MRDCSCSVVVAVTGDVDVGALMVTMRCLGWCWLVVDGEFGFCGWLVRRAPLIYMLFGAVVVDIELHVVGGDPR